MTTVRRPMEPDVAQLPLITGADAGDIESLLRSLSRGSSSPPPGTAEIHIERLIEHEIDHKNRHIELADTPVTLGDHEKFFAEHLATGDARAEWAACFDNPRGDIPRLCRELLGTTEQFIEASKALAQRLYDVMRTRRIARGDFVAAVFTKGNDPTRHIAILKLDPDSRRIRTFRKIGGQTRVDISIADNILPESRTLAKCALITLPNDPPDAGAPSTEWDIRLLDTQAGTKANEVAAFFFRGFLNTELVPTARRRTREFVRSCDAWLHDRAADLTPADLIGFWDARRAVLATDAVDVGAFVAEALPTHPELHEELATRLERAITLLPRAQTETIGRFQVDPSVARPLVEEVVLELDAGARLVVPSAHFAELVQIERDFTAQGKYRIVIQSQTLKEVSKR